MGVGNREWGVGSGEWGMGKLFLNPIPHSPLPTPHSPLSECQLRHPYRSLLTRRQISGKDHAVRFKRGIEIRQWHILVLPHAFNEGLELRQVRVMRYVA